MHLAVTQEEGLLFTGGRAMGGSAGAGQEAEVGTWATAFLWLLQERQAMAGEASSGPLV